MIFYYFSNISLCRFINYERKVLILLKAWSEYEKKIKRLVYETNYNARFNSPEVHAAQKYIYSNEVFKDCKTVSMLYIEESVL